MQPMASTGLTRLAAGLSGNPDAARAAEQVCAQCADGLGAGSTDLAMVFATSHHVGNLEAVARIIRHELRVDCLVGVSTEGAIGGRSELERSPGVSLLAARLPGVSLTPFTGDELMPYDQSPEGLAKVSRAMGADESLRAAFVFADPFSVPMMNLLPVLNRARAEGRIGTIIGGMASAGSTPGSNALILDGGVHRSGLVGVSLRGPVRVDTVVSQGCRGFGPTIVITKARKNVILELGGKRALDVVRECVEALPADDKPLLERGLFIGRVINEYKDRFGRDDFLIRNVLGVDENQGAVAINELVRVGQTIRFHVRDARTADEDLAMLLDAQQLREPPLGGVLITCNGRGSRLFDRPHHDAAAVVKAFSPGRGGEVLAKGGEEIDPEGPVLPLAGFFAAGEIGPVGDQSYLHGQTAVLALFRNEK
jgi:small ligand-binding sensory domain FIST